MENVTKIHMYLYKEQQMASFSCYAIYIVMYFLKWLLKIYIFVLFRIHIKYIHNSYVCRYVFLLQYFFFKIAIKFLLNWILHILLEIVTHRYIERSCDFCQKEMSFPLYHKRFIFMRPHLGKINEMCIIELSIELNIIYHLIFICTYYNLPFKKISLMMFRN